MTAVIFTDANRGLVLERSSTWKPPFVEFLQRIIWGSGGVRYTMPDLAAILNRFRSPHFFSLRENGRLVGVTTLNRKDVHLGGASCPAFYAYGISVDPAHRGLGFGAILAAQRLRYALAQLGDKGLFYSYVEATNLNSLKTNARAGSRSIGNYHVLVLSRGRPRDDARVQRLPASRREQLLHQLHENYADHALLDLDQSFDPDHYYILTQSDRIAAGVQVDRHHLQIQQLPGAAGRLIVRLLPRLPLVGRLLPERNLHFLRFGNLYAANGMAAALFPLMEALLARHRLNFGMLYLDRRSPLYQQLNGAGRWGFFHDLIDVPVEVMACFKGFSSSEVSDLQRQPLFISMQDPV